MITSSVTLVTKALGKIVKILFDVFILYTIAPCPKTGYDIQKHLSRLFGVKISYGSLYPHLHALEVADLIQGKWVPQQKNKLMQKKEYYMTDKGRKILEANVEAVNKIALTLKVGMVSSEINSTSIEYTPMIQLVDFLKKQGLSARDRIKIKGNSGAEHEIDVFSTKYTNGVEQRTIFGFYDSETEVGIEDILKFYLKGYDVNANILVLLACPKLSEEAERIAAVCQIKVFQAPDLELALEMVLNDLKNISI